MKKISLAAIVLSTVLFTGCGDDNQPTLSDAVKGSFKITNGMKMEDVEKVMQIEPTGQQKIGNIVIWKYEGNTQTGEDETLKVKYNNVIVKFKDGVVINSGTFSCDLPKLTDED